MTLTKRILAAACALLVLVALAGCARAQATTNPLLGTWYDSKTGDPYIFISNSLLVSPHADSGGGNAESYRVLNGNELDILADGSHHVSLIETISADGFTLDNPVTGARQRFYRSMEQTDHLRAVEASAYAAVSNFATITASPEIVWAAPKPSGLASVGTTWTASSIQTYAMGWNWTKLKRDATPAKTSGGGDAMGYSFSFTRPVPTPAQLKKFTADSSLVATAGLSHIDVGYSASKAQYPAGTMVYLPGGMIYSLGDGFAIGVIVDKKNQSFAPMTHD